MLTSACT